MNNYTNEQIYEYGMRDITGYEGLYAVTSCGRVWSYRSKRFLKSYKEGHGYLKVDLCKNGERKKKKIHRLVLETYNPCENMEELQANHLDENKENNCLNNLSWMTAKQNCNYGTRNQRSAAARGKKVRCIDTGVIYESTKEAERQTSINQGNISKVCRGIYKSAGGLHWMFEEDYQNVLVAELLEIAFPEEEVTPEVTICGVNIDDYLAMNEAI